MGKNTELLSTLTNAKESDRQDSGSLIERKELGGGSFIAIKKDGGWFLTMGKYQITDEHENLHELEKMVSGIDWKLMITIIGVMVEESRKFNK